MKTYEDIKSAVWEEIYSSTIIHKSFNSSHEGYAVLLEELDEVWEEIKKSKNYTLSNEAKQELIQVAAVAMRMINEL
jgi:NTP pyrophosphatase (non-canonical NTP hydrolase)